MKGVLSIFAIITCAWAGRLFPPVKTLADANPVSIEKHPHQINLLYRKYLIPFTSYEHLCGGSIYSDRVIITAAHCIIKSNPSHFRVVAGSIDVNGKSGSSASVKKIIIHEGYNSDSHQNDIAILVLASALPLDNRTMRAIELADQDLAEGVMATTTGWSAMTKFDDDSDVLRETQLPIVGQTTCNEDYNRRIGASMLCAGYRGVGGNDACQEDNGAPLVANGKLVGILSWGFGCALPNYPGVYAKISYLRPWLMAKINSI